MRKLLILFWLICSQLPLAAQDERESRLLDNLEKYYNLVGMSEKAGWLQKERKAGRVLFGQFTGEEADTEASVHPRTGVITINEKQLGDNTFRGLVDLGNTLAHERVHQNQSYLGWAVETYKEDLGQGNAYEREGWAESLRVARQAVLVLRKRLSDAKSARDRERAGQLLIHAAGSWNTLLSDWNAKAKGKYGDFSPREFVDEDGLPITVDDMLAEARTMTKIGKDVAVTSKAMNVSYTGKYRGSLGGGASGSLALDVRADQSIVGKIKGSYKSSPFDGTLQGIVNADGLVSGQVFGTLTIGKTGYKFTGSISGSLSKSGGGTGQWTAGADKFWPSGSWSVNKL